VDCYIDFLEEVPSASQIQNEARVLYCTLLSACQRGVGSRILMENRNSQDRIWSWYQKDSNRNVRIKKLENVITTVFHCHYKGVLCKWIQDYADAFTELILLGKKTWNNDEV
jgi:hypothetical protein